MASTTILNPRDNASFAVSSRLLSCFVTEGILLAYYIPTPEMRSIAGTIIILSPSISSHPERTIAAKDVYCLVSLRNPPVFLDGHSTKYGRRVGLVDPLDMLPGVVEPISNPDRGSVCAIFLRLAVYSALLGPPYRDHLPLFPRNGLRFQQLFLARNTRSPHTVEQIRRSGLL
jgi:hypothetical protein